MNPWPLGLAALALTAALGWGLWERGGRLSAEGGQALAEVTAALNHAAAEGWRAVWAEDRAAAEADRRARDAATLRAVEAEAQAAELAANQRIKVYVADIASIPVPCGLVRLLDEIADDAPGAGTAPRRAALAAAAGCAGAPDARVSRLGYDRIVDGFVWLARERRICRIRHRETVEWNAAYCGGK